MTQWFFAIAELIMVLCGVFFLLSLWILLHTSVDVDFSGASSVVRESKWFWQHFDHDLQKKGLIIEE